MHFSLKQTVHRTGVERRQVLHFEDVRLIGAVARNGRGRRVYTPEQLDLIELIELLRSGLVLRLEEAGRLAREILGSPPDVSTDRIERLRRKALKGTAGHFRVLVALDDLFERRQGRSPDGRSRTATR